MKNINGGQFSDYTNLEKRNFMLYFYDVILFFIY